MISEENFNVAQKSIEAGKSVLKEILGPRLEFMKDSRYKNSVKKELGSNRFRERIKVYQESLAARTSSFDSVAFPGHSLSIGSEYEPLDLVKLSEYWSTSDTPKIDLKPELGSVVIVDYAGMGKSTHVRHYVSTVLFKHEMTPVLLDLRSIDFNVKIESRISKELGFDDKGTYRDLTEAFLSAGKITLILDGFDEIARNAQQAAAQEIQRFERQFPGVPLVITSRPQQLIPRLIKATSLEFGVFSLEQVENLLRRYDRFVEKGFGEQLITELPSVPDAFLENPLAVALMYRTYAISGTVEDRISNFYGELYSALFQGHDLKSKQNYVREKQSGLSIGEF